MDPSKLSNSGYRGKGSVPQKDKSELLQDHFVVRLSVCQDILSRKRVESTIYSHGKAIDAKFLRDVPMKSQKPANGGFWRRKFVEFSKRTDLHGFKYIVMEGLSSAERTCWALAVAISVIFAAYFVFTAYRWYARNPIITVIESTQAAIWDIPFPAITICNLNTISKKGARAFADNVTLPPNMTADAVFEAIRFAPLLHSPYLSTAEQKQQLQLLQRVLDFNKLSLATLFRTLSPAASCTEILKRCMWKNTIYHCDEMFQQIMTTYKLCCTFNYFGVPFDGNKGNVQLIQHSKPRRVASCGYQTALTVLIRTDPEDYYSALVPSQGVLVFIDSAYNIPNEDSPTRLVNPASEVLIALSPERTYTTSGIRAFTPNQRQCYYKDEIKLGEFSQYSLHNCIALRRVQVTMRICDCVPFYFPTQEYFRVCNFNDLECLENTLRPREINELEHASDKEAPTPCLPECEHYDYPLEVALGKLATDVKLTGLPFLSNLELGNCSLLNVFFSDLVSTRFRRDVYFNWKNFSAAFGGLLSLMLGFTLVAFFDLVIFFTLRLAYERFSTRKATAPVLVNENKKKINNWMEKSLRTQQLHNKDFGIRKSTNVKTLTGYQRDTNNIVNKY